MELTDESRWIIVTALLVTNDRWFDFFGRRFMWTMEENTDFEHVCQTYMFTLQSITSH